MPELIDASKLDAVFRDCLFRDDEPLDDAVLVEGIISRYGLHPTRLESHREEVVGLLGLLPRKFRRSVDGGWSFLEACRQEDGRHWGEHRNMEQLFVLGIGLGSAEWLTPREPGEMPYVVITEEPTC